MAVWTRDKKQSMQIVVAFLAFLLFSGCSTPSGKVTDKAAGKSDIRIQWPISFLNDSEARFPVMAELAKPKSMNDADFSEIMKLVSLTPGAGSLVIKFIHKLGPTGAVVLFNNFQSLNFQRINEKWEIIKVGEWAH
jgi:hypothetical protein